MSINKKESSTHEFEFVVIGGGIAGMCAALAAARKGIDTAIIQERPVFGGNSSSEIRVVPLGSSNTQAWGRETGIIEEILLEDRATNHAHLFDHGITNRHYDFVLYEKIRQQSNLTSFLNTSVRAVDCAPIDEANKKGPRRIKQVHASQLGSEKEMIFRAKHFADCTGDGTIGFLAGAEFRYGREARSEFNEPLAPLKSDDITMGSTITMSAKDIGREVPYNPPDWVTIYKSLEEIGPARQVMHIKRPLYGGYWWLEVCNPFHIIDNNSEIRDELLSHVLGVWNYIKNYSPEREIARTYVLDWVGMVPGKRESRRLMGDVIVTEHDCHEDSHWPDAVCYAGWYIDLHIGGGILNKEEPGERGDVDEHYRSWRRIPPFTLPLRAMYSRNVENLWMAGRNVSVTHIALGAMRVQQPLGNLGQAVGTAAAYALKNKLTPRQAADPENQHIKNIQQHLLRDDINVLGYKNQDSEDLALQAAATATSEAALNFGGPDNQRWQPLDKHRAQVFPGANSHVETISFYFKNERSEAIEVYAELQEIDRIWDMAHGKAYGGSTLSVPPSFEGWIPFNFNIDVTSGKPLRVCLKPAQGIMIAQAVNHPTGATAQHLHIAPGGPEPKNQHMHCFSIDECDLPAHEQWIQDKWFSYAVQIEPIPHPYPARNVVNGLAWPVDMPNLWVSDPDQSYPQCLDLSWDRPQTFDSIHLSFDTNLNVQISQLPEFWTASTCVKDYRLWVQEPDGGWRQIYERYGNYQRHNRIYIEPVTTDGLRLEVLATNGSGGQEHVQVGREDALRTVTRNIFADSARLYEIRVYNSQH